MKKIISALTAITLSLCIIPTLSAIDSYAYTINFESEIEVDTGTISKCKYELYNDDTITEVVVPSEANDNGKYYYYVRIYECPNIETLSLGKYVKTVELQNVANLKEINIDDENPYFTEIDGVVYNEEMTELLFYSRTKEDKTFTIPDTVKIINQRAFSGNPYIEEVIIPEGVTAIGMYAFQYCNLTSIELPHSLEYLGGYSLESNTQLKEITIPEKITCLISTLVNCEALETIIFLNPNDLNYKPWSSVGGESSDAYAYVFGNSRNSEDRVNPITAYVPDNQIEQYTLMAEDGWNCDYEILPLSQKPVENPQPTGIKGDVNCDNDLNIADLVILSKWITDSSGLSAQNMNDSSAADMNSDGVIDVFDSVLLRTALVTETETAE